MEKHREFFCITAIVVLTILSSGCSSDDRSGQEEEGHPTVSSSNPEQISKIVISVRDQDSINNTNEVTDTESIQKVHAIIQDAEWIKAKSDMARVEDYRFELQFEDGTQRYLVWITPNHKQLEIIIPNEKYVKLNEEDSQTLHEIMTDTALSQ